MERILAGEEMGPVMNAITGLQNVKETQGICAAHDFAILCRYDGHSDWRRAAQRALLHAWNHIRLRAFLGCSS